MYLHIGQNIIINTNSIVGIFDMDSSTVKKSTRDFLYKKEKLGLTVNACSDLPKSFIVCKNFNEYKIFITSLNSSTLFKRVNTHFFKGENFTNGIK